MGKSGQHYQIDLSFEFTKTKASFLVLIECKNYNRRVGLSVLLEFAEKIKDIGAHKGIVVTTRGFQKGSFKIALAHGIALMKAYRDGEVDPLISNRGPVVPELEAYFADYVSFKRAGSRLPILARTNPQDREDDLTALVEAIQSDKDCGDSTEGGYASSAAAPPDWWDWDSVVTPHAKVNAVIRRGFVHGSPEFVEIHEHAERAIKESIKLHKSGDHSSAISLIEAIGSDLNEVFAEKSSFDPSVSLSDIPECVYWLGYFYAARGCNDSLSWFHEFGKFQDNSDIIRALEHYREYKRQLALLCDWKDAGERIVAHRYYSELGQIYFRLGRTENAAEAFENARLVEPTHAHPFLELGLFYMEIGQCDEAIPNFEASVSKKYDGMLLESGAPEMPGLAFYNIACVYARLGELQKAIDWLRKTKDSGWSRLDIARDDADFLSLRELPEFRGLLGQ